MSLVVNTNVGSLNAQRSLTASASELKTAMERLSSGKKINSAADDAAGFAIAERMTAQIRGLNMATKNANDGLSMMAVIENATNDITDMLHRMRELAIQAANGTNGTQDLTYLDGEVDALKLEIDRIATQTKFNGTAYLSGAAGDGTGAAKTGNFQVGTENAQSIAFSINAVGSGAIGTSGGTQVSAIDITTAAGAGSALQVISDAIEQVAADRASYGALQNRLEYTVSNLMNVAEFTTSARSQIEDADFAAESARLAKAQVLQQTGAAMLAQANATPKLALQLIK
jgi:flagellin